MGQRKSFIMKAVTLHIYIYIYLDNIIIIEMHEKGHFSGKGTIVFSLRGLAVAHGYPDQFANGSNDFCDYLQCV